MPESPRFLCAKGQDEKAKEVIILFKDIDNKVEYDIQMVNSSYTIIIEY